MWSFCTHFAAKSIFFIEMLTFRTLFSSKTPENVYLRRKS